MRGQPRCSQEGGSVTDLSTRGQGTLIDREIRELAADGQLLISNFDEASVRQACYELRASTLFYDLAHEGEDKRVIVTSSDGYLLRPFQQAIAIVEETIRLPANVIGRILTKGQLFSAGILPVNTYADPGFEGRLGITLWNVSHRELIIRPGEPIAKIEFDVLAEPVEHPYNGQHGYATGIWPIPVHLFASAEERKTRLGSEVSELEATLGPRVGFLARKVTFYERWVWLQLLIVLTGFAAIFAIHEKTSVLTAIGLGVVANLLTNGLFVLLATRTARKRY